MIELLQYKFIFTFMVETHQVSPKGINISLSDAVVREGSKVAK